MLARSRSAWITTSLRRTNSALGARWKNTGPAKTQSPDWDDGVVVEKEQQVLKMQSQPPEGRKIDWIGPADPDSKLRPKKLYIPEDETATERAYRLQQEETYKWNQQFWANHNKLFFQRKERFIQGELAKLGPTFEEGETRQLTPEHLSVFYKNFLDENHSKHQQYNIEWYKRNIKLLWPAFKVMWIRMYMKRARSKNGR